MKNLAKIAAGLLIISLLAVIIGAPSIPLSLRARTAANGMAELDLKTHGRFDPLCTSRIEFSRDKKFNNSKIYKFTIGNATFSYGSIDFRLPGTPVDQDGKALKEFYARHIVECSETELPVIYVGSAQVLKLSKISSRNKMPEDKFFSLLTGKTLTAALKKQRSKEFINVTDSNKISSGQAAQIYSDLSPKTFKSTEDLLFRVNARGSKPVKYDWYLTAPDAISATKIRSSLGVELINDSFGSTLIIRTGIVDTKKYDGYSVKANAYNRFGSDLSENVLISVKDDSDTPTATPTTGAVITPTAVATSTRQPTITIQTTLTPTSTATKTTTATNTPAVATRTATSTRSPTATTTKTATATSTITASATNSRTATPTNTNIPVCTAPACTNGTLTCGTPSTGCPGGCGYVCILNITPTRTPTHTISPTSTATNTPGTGSAYTSNRTWQQIPIATPSANDTGIRLLFDMTASALNVNSLTGLSLGAADAYSDLAATVRFAPTTEGGDIDVRNGGSFASSNTVIYSAGRVYRVEMNVDLVAKRYSVNIDGSPVAVDYSFRTEQANVSSLNTLNIYSDSGSHTISDIAVELIGSGPANGVCGTANGGTTLVAPSTNLCSSGTASAVITSGNTYSWTCNGRNGGTNSSCSSSRDITPVNGVCGSADGASFRSLPATNLCTVGTPGSVSRAGDTYIWTCFGINTGSNDNCSATHDDNIISFPIEACNNLVYDGIPYPVPCEKPTKANTGLLTQKDRLTIWDGGSQGSFSTTRDGQIVENIWFKNAHVWIRHNNVTFKNNFVDNGSVKLENGANNFLIEHNELTNPEGRSGFNEHLVTRGGGTGTIRSNYAYKNKGDFVKPGSNQLFECNYVESLSTDLGSHSDAVQFQGGTSGYENTSFRFNNFDIGVPSCTDQNGNTQPLCTPNSGTSGDAILIAGSELRNITFECNYNLNGGNYSVSLNEGSTNFLNNYFGCDFLFGIRNGFGSDDKWCNNILSCTGQLTHPNSANCPATTDPTRTPTRTPSSSGPTFTATRTATATSTPTTGGSTFTPTRTATATSTSTKAAATFTPTATPTSFTPTGTSIYIRSGASGDGSSWSSALPNLPENLTRGATYFIADGDYPAYTFNDPLDGTKYTTVIKATESNHGTNTGWLSNYGDGIARFQSFTITNTKYFILDGTPARKFLLKPDTKQVPLHISDAQYLTVIGIDAHGNFEQTKGCTASNILSSSYITFKHNHIHDVGDDGILINNTSQLLFEDNEIYDLYGSDNSKPFTFNGVSYPLGFCNNGHSDGIEIVQTTDTVINRNYFHNIDSTSGILPANWSGTTPLARITFSNNILHTPITSAAAHFHNMNDSLVVNNTFGQSQYAGIWIEPKILLGATRPSSNLVLRNNIISSYGVGDQYYDDSDSDSTPELDSDYNLIISQERLASADTYIPNTNDLELFWPENRPFPSNLFTASNLNQLYNPGSSHPDYLPNPVGYTPDISNPGINKGTTNIPGTVTVNNTVVDISKDFFGNDRIGAPDMGAVEYRGSALNGFLLSVARYGAGTVTATGVNCGSDCSEVYNSGASVTLTASPFVNATFAGWYGACSGTATTCTVTMNNFKNVRAKFTGGIDPDGWAPGTRVKATASVNVRSSHFTTATLLVALSEGATGSVMEGPADGSGITWYKIDWDSQTNDKDGWVGMDKLEVTSRPDVTPTVTPTATRTATITPTATNTVQGPTNTPTRTPTNTATATSTATRTATSSVNQPPLVNAGSDISITAPADLADLTGVANDPDGSIASVNWSQISGPNSATIVENNVTDTVAINLVAGTYVFRFRATDNNGLSSSDDVQVTVSPAVTVSCTGLTSTTAYQNCQIPAQTESFKASFDIIPAANGINAIAGFSADPVTAQNHLNVSALVRFDIDNTIDFYNGSSWQNSGVSYSANQAYSFLLTVHVASNSFTASINGTPIAGNFNFRKTASSINYFSYVHVSGQPITVNNTAIAPYNPDSFTLRVRTSGSGSVVGSQLSAGNSCGAGCTEYQYPTGSEINLVASPLSSSTFTGWSGSCSGKTLCTITLNSDKEVTASFSSGIAGTTYQESSGLLLMEAENTTSSLGSGSDRWERIIPGNSLYVQGATNDAHLEYKGVNKYTGVASGEPVLNYTFKVNQDGYYRIMLRARKRIGCDPANTDCRTDVANDCYIKLGGDNFDAGPNAGNNHMDDAPKSMLTSFTKIYDGNHDSWGWSQLIDAGGENNKRQPVYKFYAGSTYTLSIAGRSQYYNLDRIVFHHFDVPATTAKDPSISESSKVASGSAIATPTPTATPTSGPAGACVTEGGSSVMDKVTVKCTGPTVSETDAYNPFYNYRMDVTFTKGSKSFVVPGYFAADGDAANSSATSGNQFHALFRPDESGTWNYSVSFRTGDKVAVAAPGSGSATSFNGSSGSFNVGTGISAAVGKMADGRLKDLGNGYIGTHLNNKPIIKLGPGTPENFLSYAEFDSAKTGSTSYSAHVTANDWKTGDPSWKDGKGKGIIGVLNYLASTGANALYFMFTNIDSDNEDVTPHLGSYTTATVDRYDVSKLAQWNIVFEHANKLGIILNIFFHDDESGSRALFGSAGDSDLRKLYFREMIARFGSLPLIQYDISEEYNKTAGWAGEAVKAGDIIRSLDPYKQIPVSVHTTNVSTGSSLFDAFAPKSWFSPITLQLETSDPILIGSNTEHWLNKGKALSGGRTIPISVDEPQSFTISTTPDKTEAMSYALIFSGGWGLQLYEGTSAQDAAVANFRTADTSWKRMGYARKFAEENLPLGAMQADDSIDSGATGSPQIYKANDGSVFAVYYPDGSSPGSLNLGSSKIRNLSWYNPRTGSFVGNAVILNSSAVSIPSAPSDPTGSSWVALIR